MPPRKRSKDDGGRAKKVQRAYTQAPILSSVSSTTLPPQPEPSTPLDITPHPGILQQVLLECSPSTLATFLRCSKHLFQLAAPVLYRNIDVPYVKFAGMIGAGYASKQGSTAGMLGRGYSPLLKEAWKYTKYLHLRDIDPKLELPIIPRHALPNLSTIIIHASLHSTWASTAAVPPRLLSVHPPDLVIRLPDKGFQNPGRFGFGLYIPAASVERTTVLLPFSWDHPQAPAVEQSTWKPTKMTVTIVLLPRTSEAEAIVPPSPRSLPGNFWSRVIRSSITHPIRFVGAEYYGVYPEGRPTWGGSRKVISFARFTDWLDEQEHGAIFSQEEEVALREADVDLLASLEVTEASTAAQG